MKLFWGIIGLGFAFLSSCRTPKGWQQTWKEDFNGNGSFNEATWSKIPRGKVDWNRHMSDFDSCYALRRGKMVLRGLVNHSLPTDTTPYLTGGIYTKGKKGFSNGRLEIKAKLNGAKGAWPAFWLLPENDQWPDGGEIDIMERLNYDSIAYQTVHSYYTYTLGIENHPRHSATGKINPHKYNIYGVELHQDSLVFFINYHRTFSYPRIQTDKKGQFPFAGKDFYLLLDMQLGGTWVGKVNPKELPMWRWKSTG